MKMFTSAYFLLAIFLSTKFKLSISMLVVLVKMMRFYITVHAEFTEKAREKKLDAKIQMRLRKFYHVFLTRVGLEKDIKMSEEKLETHMERHLYLFTQKLKTDELRSRR